MAFHAALDSSRIPTSSRLPSKDSHSFSAQCFSKKLEVTEFSGLRSSGCVTFSKSNRDTSFFVGVAAQLTPEVSHLLKYDSMLGTFKADVKIVDKETISVDGKPIKGVSSRDPLQLPWAELGIDMEHCVYVDGPGAGKHIQAGAKKALITAPAKGADIGRGKRAGLLSRGS